MFGRKTKKRLEWWEERLDGHRGWCEDHFTRTNGLFRMLMEEMGIVARGYDRSKDYLRKDGYKFLAVVDGTEYWVKRKEVDMPTKQ